MRPKRRGGDGQKDGFVGASFVERQDARDKWPLRLFSVGAFLFFRRRGVFRADMALCFRFGRYRKGTRPARVPLAVGARFVVRARLRVSSRGGSRGRFDRFGIAFGTFDGAGGGAVPGEVRRRHRASRQSVFSGVFPVTTR